MWERATPTYEIREGIANSGRIVGYAWQSTDAIKIANALSVLMARPYVVTCPDLKGNPQTIHVARRK